MSYHEPPGGPAQAIVAFCVAFGILYLMATIAVAYHVVSR